MKKIFNFCMIALVAMVAFTSCSDDCNPEYLERDYTQDLVGTWTCLDADHAEALVFKAGGTFASYGVSNGEYSEELNATWVLKNNKLTLAAGDYKSDVVLEIVPGKSMALVDEKGKRNVFEYCANDLSDEIIGMWVCNDFPTEGESDMMIETFYDNGKSTLTGFLPLEGDYEQVLNEATDYKVVGDLLFITIPADKVGGEKPLYVVDRLVYSPNGTASGDVMTLKSFVVEENQVEEIVMSFLRIKQHLDLAEKKYDYIKTFVTNVKGLDKDIDFMGYTFNFAKMDGYILDKMLKTILFTVEFPDANTIKYGCHYNNEPMAMEAPIAVDGNKMTVKMSEKNAAFRDIDLYTFQDQDNTQMHMYMPTYAFVNFFGNMQCTMMSQLGQLDLTDAAAVKAVYDSIDEAVETINVSFVMTKAAK